MDEDARTIYGPHSTYYGKGTLKGTDKPVAIHQRYECGFVRVETVGGKEKGGLVTRIPGPSALR